MFNLAIRGKETDMLLKSILKLVIVALILEAAMVFSLVSLFEIAIGESFVWLIVLTVSLLVVITMAKQRIIKRLSEDIVYSMSR